jgi:hypothetical protein
MTPWFAVFAFYHLLFWLSFLAIGYGLLLRRIATIVQPHRLRLAERGEKYLAVCKDPEERALVNFYLDNAFNPWIAISAFFTLPIVIVQEIWRPAELGFVPADEDAHRSICGLASISAFAANPLFGSLVVIELLIASIAVALVVGNISLIKRAVLALIDSQIPARRGDRRIPAN